MSFFEKQKEKKVDNSLWTELFRPDSLDGYIGNDTLKENVESYIEKNDIPHLLLHGIQGTGKTTLAKLIVKNMNCDYLMINASDENGIDIIRDKIKTFASSMGFSGTKVIILDEADFLSGNAQAGLRNVMETFSAHCRFILTCNYLEKIIPPVQSRCQIYQITPPSKKEVALRLKTILEQEKVKFDIKDVAKVVNKGYPDIRRVINDIQQSSTKGTLKVDEKSLINSDVASKVVEIFNSNITPRNKLLEIRQLVADNSLHDFSDIYTYLYKNIDTYTDANLMPLVILQIAEGVYRDSQVIDKEIIFSAVVVEILNIIK